MQTGDIAIVRCPMNYANRQLQNEVVKVIKIWDLGNMADVRILSGVHKGERWQFVLSHLRKRGLTSRAVDLLDSSARSALVAQPANR